MSAYGEARWHDKCSRGCSSCLGLDNNNEHGHSISKRFVTVGSVRYGVRLGAVSPPPPGAGARFRTQCCWPTTIGDGVGPSGVGVGVPVPVSVTGTISRIPLLAPSPINSRDIFSCVNRVRMAEESTSELPEQATVRDQLVNSTKSLLKSHLRRRVFTTQVYDRLYECECGEVEGIEFLNTLDRFPRFRFGGNRGTASKLVDRTDRERDRDRDRDKRNNEQRLRELADRFKKVPVPVPPPRTRHMPQKTSSQPKEAEALQTQLPQDSPAPVENRRVAPSRSISFSQVDYSAHDNKYVRKHVPSTAGKTGESISGTSLTLPRAKTSTARSLIYNDKLETGIQTTPTAPADVDDSVHTQLKPGNATAKDEPVEIQSLSDSSLTECIVRNSGVISKDSTNAQEKKRDKSRRRKGMYISQWPHTYQSPEEVIPNFTEDLCNTVHQTKDIPKLEISVDKSDSPDRWNHPLDSIRPDDDNRISEWTRSFRPVLSAQNSEEKDSPRSKCVQLLRADSLSEGDPDVDRRSEVAPSDISDCESRTSIGNDVLSPHIQRRYSKRPLRGPYGQMLEAEMKKPEAGRKNQYTSDLKFLEDLSTGSGTCSMVSLSSSSSVGASDKPKFVTRTRGASNHSLDDSQLKANLLTPINPMAKRKVSVDSVASQELDNSIKLVVSHQRTTSSPSKLEGFAPTEASHELLEQLLRASSEQIATETNLQRLNDTRTHVVVELFDTEQSYVESLQILVTKYYEPLKSPENAALIDPALVDEMFFQIPSLMGHHQLFLSELQKRLEHWDAKQKIGDVLLTMFANDAVIESYSGYVNNSKRARDIHKSAQQSKPAFARFLGAMAREHKGKLALDSLLIKPVQKLPKYELLLQRLIKHTDPSHPDHNLLLAAQEELHEQLLKLNCTEREALELDQLREIEGLIEGLFDLVTSDRQYLRHDLVNMSASGGARKERALFLFSDLLLITSIKRRSGTIRRPTTATPSSVTSTLEANKYKLLMKIPLDDLEIVKSKDDSVRQMMLELDNLNEDISILNQINELTWTLNCNHSTLDELIRDMLTSMNKQLIEQQNSDSQLSCLDLTLNMPSGLENICVIFSKPDKKTSWEEAFHEAKDKLATSDERRPCPELVAAVPIRKTRAGLQFTCAAPTHDNSKDVWVCNSDGYVGQVCVLSLLPEPTVTSCNGVCNARILCISSVPGISVNQCLPTTTITTTATSNVVTTTTNTTITTTTAITSSSTSTATSNVKKPSKSESSEEHANTIQFDSSSSEDDEEKSDGEEMETEKRSVATAPKSPETISIESDELDSNQSTMWLGTEDGCIHVYNSNDNIRIKKNKIRLQHGSSILCIIYLENKVFVSLANGDLVVYERDNCGVWNTSDPVTVSVGTTTMSVSKMLPNNGKMWCACGNTIKIFNIETLSTESSFNVSNDINKPITSIVISDNGVWLSLQNSAVVKCFHAISHEFLTEVNVAQAVTKMLTSCDDIIRQHKAACLRVTSLLACKDLLWIGTSAGVLLTMPLPHITATQSKLSSSPCVVGVPHGHTGHVRFLAYVEWTSQQQDFLQPRLSYKPKAENRAATKVLVISGGDGYEDFRSSNLSEVAGREDSTNHLLLWNI